MMNSFPIKNPGPIASSDDPLPRYTVLYKGMVLQVEKDGQWWAAEILATLDDGRAVVHYLGWDLSLDEIVPRARLQLDRDALEKAIAVGPMEVLTHPGPVEPTGIELALNDLSHGDSVLVLWNDAWWLGQVTHFEDDGQVGIHYCGWDKSWDEIVPLDRLQRAPEH